MLIIHTGKQSQKVCENVDDNFYFKEITLKSVEFNNI